MTHEVKKKQTRPATSELLAYSSAQKVADPVNK